MEGERIGVEGERERGKEWRERESKGGEAGINLSFEVLLVHYIRSC